MSELIRTPEEFIAWSQTYGKEFVIIERSGGRSPWRTDGPNNDALVGTLHKLFVLQSSFSVVFSEVGKQERHFRVEKAGGQYARERVFQAKEIENL